MRSSCMPSSRPSSLWRFADLAFCVLVAALACSAAQGQVSATLRGVVTDASSTVVPGAEVTVRSLETGATRTTTTDDAGRYLVVSLPVGEYEVRITKSGFQEEVRSGIRLVVGQDATVDLTLQVSAVKSEIRVAGDSAIVNTSTSDISGLVGERQIKELPLN